MTRNRTAQLDLGRYTTRLLAQLLLGLALLVGALGALDYSDTGSWRSTGRTMPMRAL